MKKLFRARVKDSQSFSHDLFSYWSPTIFSHSLSFSLSFFVHSSRILSFIHISVISYKAVVNNFFLSLFFKKKIQDVSRLSQFLFLNQLSVEKLSPLSCITNNACVSMYVCECTCTCVVYMYLRDCAYKRTRAYVYSFSGVSCIGR